MKRITLSSHAGLFLAALLLTPALTAGIASAGDGTARYSVTFVPTWNPASHPIEYPITHARGGLMTPIIGATHGSDYAIFMNGRKPTPGLERLSEMGKHDPLDSEIEKAIRNGQAGSLITFAEPSAGPVHPVVSSEFEIQSSFPMVSLVGMLAPSPDWFYGVSGVTLFENGQWAPQMTVTVYAWDSGGDRAMTYMAEDADTDPKQTTGYASTKHFLKNGQRVPVGAFTFKRIPSAVTGS